MDERVGYPSPPFYINRGFHGSGSKPQPNPNLSLNSHSSIRFKPAIGSDRIEPPPAGFPHSSNKKRGRPKKYPTPAVGSGGSPDPTAPTPQKTRGDFRADGLDHPDLSRLKPPSRSNGFRTGEEFVKLLKSASSVLIAGIQEAANANEMIDLSSKAFVYFDSIGVDYTPVYKAVCSVINHHCHKEALVKQRPHSAFDTKAEHNQAVTELSEAKERYARVDRELEDGQHDLDGITAHVKRLEEELKKGNEKKAALEAKVGAAQVDKVVCQEAYCNAKAKMENIAPKMGGAQKAIDEFERRWKENMDGLNRAIEEASRFRI